MAERELRLKLTGDSSQAEKATQRLERALAKAEKALEEAKAEAGQADEKIEDVAGAADTAAREVDQLGDKASTTGRKVKGLGDDVEPTTRELDGLGSKAGQLAKDRLGPLGEAADALGVDLENVDSKLLVAGAGMAAVAGFAAQGISKFNEYANEVRRVKTETNASWEESSRLTSTFKGLGLEVANSAEMMGELARNINDGKLDEFGIQAVRAKNGTVDLVGTLGNVADVMNRTIDPTKKSAMGAALFGEEWSQLAPLLSRGRDGIDELMASVSESEIVTRESAQASAEFQQALRDSQKAVNNLQMAVGKQMLPTLSLMVKDLASASDALTKLTGGAMGLGDLQALASGTFGLYNARVKEQKREADEAAWSLRNLGDAVGGAALKAGEAGSKAQELADAQESAAAKAEILTRRQEDVSRAAEAAARGVESHRRQLDLLNGAVTTYVGAELAAERAQMSTIDATEQLAGASTNLTTQINTQGAASSEAYQAQQLYDRQLNSTKAAADAQAKAQADLAQKTAEASGLTFTAEQYNIVYRDSLVKIRDAVQDENLKSGLDGLITKVDGVAIKGGEAAAQLDAAEAAARRLAAVAAGVGTTNQGTITAPADRAERILTQQRATAPAATTVTNNSVTVNAQTNADPWSIAKDVDWALRTAGR